MKSQGDVIMPWGIPRANPGAKQSNGVWGLGMPQIPQVGALLVHNQVLSFVDGEQAPCNKEIQGVKLVIGDYYDNQAVLKVVDLPHHDIILRKPWLERHNLDIDWVKNEVSIFRKGK